jgi:hypothetical protein
MKSVPVTKQNGEDNRFKIRNSQRCTYKFHYKGDVLVEPLKVAHRTPGSCCTPFKYRCFIIVAFRNAVNPGA